MHGSQYVLKGAQFFGRRLAQKFQCDMQIFGAHPFCLRRDAAELFELRGECGANLLWNRNGDEESHAEAAQSPEGTRRGCALPS